MNYQQALGLTIRDARIHARLTRDAFAEITSRSYMREIERGLTTVGIDMLACFAERLGMAPSELMLVAEARMAGEDLTEHARARMKHFTELAKTGKLQPISTERAAKGVRGNIAETTKAEVERLQGAGWTQSRIAKKLGVSPRTVRRYWLKMSVNSGTYQASD